MSIFVQRLRYYLAFVVALGLLSLAPAATKGEDADIIEAVRKHWPQRQASITSCCVRYTGTVLYPAKSMQHEPSIGPGLFPDHDVVGEIEMDCILDFARGRFRVDCLRHRPIDDEIVKERDMHLFDGEHFVLYVPKDEPANARRFPEGRKSAEVSELKKDATNLVFFDQDRPMFFACGRVPIPFKNIEPFQPADWRDAPVTAEGSGVVSGHDCTILRLVRDKARPSRYVEVWIDKKNPLIVRRYGQVSNGVLINETVIDYEDGHDIPAGWVQRQFGTPVKPDALRREFRVKVERFDINCDAENAAFTAPTKPGMVVRKGRDYYRIGQDSSSLVPYVDRPSSRRRWLWYAAAIAISFAVIGVMLGYVRRKRSSGSPRATPEDNQVEPRPAELRRRTGENSPNDGEGSR
jgi:hypothetical protein